MSRPARPGLGRSPSEAGEARAAAKRPAHATGSARAVAVLAFAGVWACGGDAPGRGPLIVIDGEFADWDTVPSLLVDPAENGPGAVDFGDVRVESDDGAVYFAIDFGRPVNAQAMQGTVRLELDTDGDSATGTTAVGQFAGADRIIIFSPRSDRLFAPVSPVGQGIMTLLPGEEAGMTSVYGMGLHYAPTWASRYTELRIERTVFTGTSLRGRLVYTAPSGETADETDVFEATLREPVGRSAVSADATAIERAPDIAFRLLSWNVSDRGPADAPDAFARIVTTLEPDVILFDEVSPAIETAWFEERLSALAGDWTVIRGAAGGRQTTLIASRLPLEPVPGLARIPYPDSIFDVLGLPSTPQLQRDLAAGLEDAMPALGAALDAGGSRVLLVTLDLQCCGHAGSTEDRARIMMAEAIRGAAATALDEGTFDAVVIGGDFNLVGSRTPLDRIVAGLDPGGGDLQPAPAMRLNGASMATWRSDGPFPPGRLDFVLHSPSSLVVARAFAFEIADLDAAAARALGLADDDSHAVSDHLPIIVDFAMIGRAR